MIRVLDRDEALGPPADPGSATDRRFWPVLRRAIVAALEAGSA
ncbi:hypothetical protein ABZ465_16000 [Streptomyces griseoincarnatus]